MLRKSFIIYKQSIWTEENILYDTHQENMFGAVLFWNNSKRKEQQEDNWNA